MLNNSFSSKLANIVEASKKCEEAFAHFSELLDEQKSLAQGLRNTLTPLDLIDKTYIMNRPHKWGSLKNIRPYKIEIKNATLFTNDKGELRILPYYKHLDVYDFVGIQNFLGQFQEISKAMNMDKENETPFFDENSTYMVLWAEDMDSYEEEVNAIFDNPAFLYEYVIIKMS